MGKTARKSYHHGGLREALVTAGTALIEQEGLGAFTLRECARRAGVSHAAPKNHFASAEDLLAEIAARGFEAFVAALGAAADAARPQEPDARLIAMGRAYVAFAEAHPAVYGLMFRRGARIRKSDHLDRAALAAWQQLHGGVVATIGPDAKDDLAKAAHVWSLVHGIASLKIDRRLPPRVDAERLLAVSLNTLPRTIRNIG